MPESCMSYYNEVQAELREVVNSNPLALYGMLRYHMGWQDEQGYPSKKSGKLIRPILCLLSCQTVGGNTSQIVPIAAAMELVHNWSLIHDDIEDASSQRHQRPTVWQLWGQPQAINAGDAMFILAYQALIRLKDKGVAEKKIMYSTYMLNRTCLELCEGQYLDIDYENRFDITINDCLSVIAKKTAALMAVSTYLGAYLGSEDDRLLNSLYGFGKELGMAYQIWDDILGIWGSEKSTGKSASDISQRKKTLPLVYGLQNSNCEDRNRLLELYSQKYIQGGDILEVVNILNRLRAKDYAQDLAKQYYHRALTQLEATGLEASRQASLKEMACFVAEHN